MHFRPHPLPPCLLPPFRNRVTPFLAWTTTATLKFVLSFSLSRPSLVYILQSSKRIIFKLSIECHLCLSLKTLSGFCIALRMKSTLVFWCWRPTVKMSFAWRLYVVDSFICFPDLDIQEQSNFRAFPLLMALLTGGPLVNPCHNRPLPFFLFDSKKVMIFSYF